MRCRPAFTHPSLEGRAAAAVARESAVAEVRRATIAAALRLQQSRRRLNLALDPICTVARLEAAWALPREAPDAG